MPLPLNWETLAVDPQKVQVSVILRITMAPDSTEMNRWSPSLILNRRLVSAGMTIRPRSSILRAIPESIALSRSAASLPVAGLLVHSLPPGLASVS